MAHILLATADERQRTALSGNLIAAGHDVFEVADEPALLHDPVPHDIDCIILDLGLVGGEELDIVSYVVQAHPGIPVVLLAPRDRVDDAASALRRGAYFYVLTPVNLDDLFHIVDSALRQRERLARLREFEQLEVEDLFADSPAMHRVVAVASKVAPTDATVLLLGESGVGKEVVAEMIHRLSPRFDKPFVPINCSALPETLLESELFGHAKGAFTGAISDRRGLFAEAHLGTMFLDEIGDMPPSTQSKLLRVLQDREVRRIGENVGERVDVRVIAATNQDLHTMMEERRFREDLFYRLNVVQIHIPPLRERMETVPRLIGQFLARYNRQFGKHITGVDRQAQVALMSYDYPGNVRELENIIEYAAIMCDAEVLRLVDLPDSLHRAVHTPALPLQQAPLLLDEMRPPSAESSATPAVESRPGPMLTLQEVEKRHIADILIRCDGNQTQAAEQLGISRSTLWRKMKEYGLRTEG